MVAITDFEGTPMPVLAPGRKLTVALAGTSLALCLAAGGFIFQGGGFAARLVLAAASLAFVVAYVAKPLCRLIPSDATRAMARESIGLTQAFAGMYAVFLSCIVLPGFFAENVISMPTLAFAALSALILAVMMFGTSTKRALGSLAGRAILGLSNAYFWCAFAASDLNHLVGPHRATLFDSFYEISLGLLVLALLVRFADTFIERRRVRMAEAL
jgi:hypothetical protein